MLVVICELICALCWGGISVLYFKSNEKEFGILYAVLSALWAIIAILNSFNI